MILIAGSGLAGMIAALELAPLPCTLLTRAALAAEASTPWAQGGIAAAVGPDDAIALHVADTLAAGDGLCDADAVARIVGDGPSVIDMLRGYGVRFDMRPDGKLCLGLEAAHSRHRIVHANGDATGAEIARALVEAVRRTPSIDVRQAATLQRVAVAQGRVCGAWIDGGFVAADAVVLATGGLGGLFEATTNPVGSVGGGIAMALRAGAAVRDMEFVQFHPTALDTGAAGRVALISEAVRGEGARLVDETGTEFTDALAARDVVARAIHAHRGRGHRTLLDATGIEGFAARFPAITAICAAHGIDPRRQPIPVRPAAHYHMGGIAVDAAGRSTLPGLWACGEVACTGLHGANRLASNSLLEAASCGRSVARAIAADGPGGALAVACAQTSPPDWQPPTAARRAGIRAALSAQCGVVRDAAGLRTAIDALQTDADVCDDALVALAIATAALARRESRGAQARSDHPRADPPGRAPAATRGTWDAVSIVEAARERTPLFEDLHA